MGETTITVGTALTSLWEVVGSCIDFISKNSLLMTMFVASLVIIGFKIVKKAKSAAKK